MWLNNAHTDLIETCNTHCLLCMHNWVVIYTCINTLFYGYLVIGKHSCFCNIPTSTFVNMYTRMYSCNRVALYPAFIAVVILL